MKKLYLQMKLIIEKDEKELICEKQDLKKILEIEYLHTLNFVDLKTLKDVKKRVNKAAKNKEFTKDQIWLGFYYEDEITSGFIPDVKIKWIDNVKEFGLFANRDFKPFSYIGAYSGIVRRYKKHLDDRNAYCFEYTIGYKKTPYTIDAQERGSIVRFINHSQKPNLTPVSVVCNEIMYIIFRTNDFVAKGEEFTYDYGENYWKKREKPL